MSQETLEFDVIGTALTSQNGCFEKVATLDPDDFSTPELSLIFRVMRELHATGEPLEFMKIASGLKKHCDAKILDSCLNYLSKIPTQRDYFESRMNTFDGMIETIRRRGFDPYKVLQAGCELAAMDVKVEAVVSRLIFANAINLFSARGGMGKTILSLQIANAIIGGTPFLGLETLQRPVVYIDFENSLPTLIDRIKRLRAGNVLFWHSSNPVKPPRLDSPDWAQYKRLPKGAVIIFDTLKASHNSDENSSKEMGVIMNRLKEIRDAGFTILLLHHTPKANDKIFKGSGVIYDLSDHVLALYKVRKGSFKELADDSDIDDGDFCYRFGTKDKTRYEPFATYVEFDPVNKVFVTAQDPEAETLETIHGLLKGRGSLNQAGIIEIVKAEIGIKSRGKICALLKKGTGTYWKVVSTGIKNVTAYVLL